MNLTTHAIERYHQRICPEVTLGEAGSRLADKVNRATKIKGNTKYGQLRYDAGDCTLIVKETADAGLMVVNIYPVHGRDPATILKWTHSLSNATIELHALIDSVCRPVEPSGGVVAPKTVERAPKPKPSKVGDLRAAMEAALEGAERCMARVKDAEKDMRTRVEAAEKSVGRARQHATLKHEESASKGALIIDLIRALPEDMALSLIHISEPTRH